jgi:iron uptake system component EfeO
VRSPFTVAGTVALAATDATALARAAARYKAWLVAEAVALLEGTREFLDAVRAGEVARAKALYPSTRLHWERFETIAESFGDLDASIDSGEADVAVGQAWTGWHRFEKALWVDASLTGLEPEVGRLASDTALLVTRVRGVRLTPEAVVTAARELLDEIATGKVPGLEEPYSRTDLWDLKGNLDGARAAFDVVADIVRARNAALHDRLLRAFDALQAAMDAHRRADGFVRYDELSPAQVKELAVRVDALAEPLSELPGAVIT